LRRGTDVVGLDGARVRVRVRIARGPARDEARAAGRLQDEIHLESLESGRRPSPNRMTASWALRNT